MLRFHSASRAAVEPSTAAALTAQEPGAEEQRSLRSQAGDILSMGGEILTGSPAPA